MNTAPASAAKRSGKRATPGVLFRGMVYDGSGYADETRGLVFGLHRAGIPLQLDPLGVQHDFHGLLANEELEELELLKHRRVDFARGVLFQHAPAHDFNLAMRGRSRIGRTMFETDSIPDGWLEYCKAMDEVWVPSAFNRGAFAAAGIPERILRVLPSGVDTSRFRSGLKPLPIARRAGFNFLSVFEWTHRKGPDVLLKAYLSEFKPDEDVALILKTYGRPDAGASLLPRLAYFVERQMGIRIEDAAAILIFAPGFLPTEDIPRLYSSVDAFVLPSRGEGYGRPYMEALACECPVIATRWSGQMDFLHDGNCDLIDCELAPVPWNTDVELFSGHRWAEPDVGHLRQLMRRVFEHRQEARNKAICGRAEMIRDWDWDKVIRERWIPEFERILG